MSRLGGSLVNVVINGNSLGNCLEAEVTSSGGTRASTFRAGFALGSAPNASAIWASVTADANTGAGIPIEIQFGVEQTAQNAIAWSSEIVGTIDHISYDAGRGTIELEGRDLMSRLIRPPSTQNYVNQTSSEIVTDLGAAAGLGVQADPTTTIVGQYYQLEHSRNALSAFARFKTSLDMVTYLAQLEGYDCYVKGNTLFFTSQASSSAQSILIDVANLGVTGSLPVTQLRFDRRTSFDNGAQITVKSWNSRQRTSVEAQYPAPFDGTSSFIFVAPNLLHDTATQRAQSLYRDIARHGLVVSGEVANCIGMDIGSLLQIKNSIGWDGSYVIDSLTKHISARRGSTQMFVAYTH